MLTPRRRKKVAKCNDIAADGREDEVGSSGSVSTAKATHKSHPTLRSTRSPEKARGFKRTSRTRFNTPHSVEVRSPPSPTPGEVSTRQGHPYPPPRPGYGAQFGRAHNRADSEDISEDNALGVWAVPLQQLSSSPIARTKETYEDMAVSNPSALYGWPWVWDQLDPMATTSSPPLWQVSLPNPTARTGWPSMFNSAHGLSIHDFDPTLAPLVHTDTLHNYLEPHVAHGAAYDSSERCDAPACHEETRVALRAHMVSWLQHDDSDDESMGIMWLSGPAGSGKTAIAGSIARACSDAGSLAASFFFSSFPSSSGRHSKRCVITTMASHLAQHEVLQEFKTQLLLSIQRNPSIFRKRLKEQAECLILAPLRFLQGRCDTASWPKGIVLDGLDEVQAQQDYNSICQEVYKNGDDDQLEILDALLTLSQSPSFPFRIFISSRPEHHIVDFFATAAQSCASRLFLDSKYNPDADIELFLKAKFAEIRRRSRISDLLWPGQTVLDRLVEMSSGQFIVPATIIRWIESGAPQEQLDEALQLQWGSSGSRYPFAGLDALYCHILNRARNPDKDPRLVIKWILSISSATLPRRLNHPPPAEFWRRFLEGEEGEFDYRMSPITSLISIPPPNNARSCITIYHKSLIDFLSSEARCGDLYVDETGYNSFVTDRIVKVLKDKGPTGPSSAASPAEMLDDFLDLKLVGFPSATSQDRVSRYSASFLRFLNAESGTILASCDAAWWAGVSTLRDRSLIQGIYCGIHKAMCGSNAPSTQSVMGLTHCHAACVRWRTGILARAKEDNWCVHELEEIPVGELEALTFEEAESRFRKLGRQDDGLFLPPCDICRCRLD